jgi:hydroxyacylglutathione hydrolase
MKTFIKIIAVALGIVLLLIGMGGIFIWSTLPKLEEDRIELPHGVVGVNTGFSYAWLIPTAHGILLVDAGHDNEGAAIKAELHHQGFAPEDVHTIILTHGHTDHWGGTAVFPQAAIYIHEADVPLLNGESEETSNPLLAFFQRQMTRGLVPPAAFQTISEDQVLEIDGEKVAVYSVPGHTLGSIAILWQDILFLGDAVQKGETGLVPPPEMFSQHPEQNKASLARLLHLDFSIIAVAHSDVIENGRENLQQFVNTK